MGRLVIDRSGGDDSRVRIVAHPTVTENTTRLATSHFCAADEGAGKSFVRLGIEQPNFSPSSSRKRAYNWELGVSVQQELMTPVWSSRS